MRRRANGGITEMRTLLVVGLVATITIVTGHAGAAAETPSVFDDALKSAQVNASTPDGKAFDADIGKQFGEHHGDTMVRCTHDVPESELASFELLLKLAADGKVQEGLVRPETKIATCLQKTVVNDTFQKPQRAGYWVRIKMSLGP
jgi:hypothetical protein